MFALLSKWCADLSVCAWDGVSSGSGHEILFDIFILLDFCESLGIREYKQISSIFVLSLLQPQPHSRLSKCLPKEPTIACFPTAPFVYVCPVPQDCTVEFHTHFSNKSKRLPVTMFTHMTSKSTYTHAQTCSNAPAPKSLPLTNTLATSPTHFSYFLAHAATRPKLSEIPPDGISYYHLVGGEPNYTYTLSVNTISAVAVSLWRTLAVFIIFFIALHYQCKKNKPIKMWLMSSRVG